MIALLEKIIGTAHDADLRPPKWSEERQAWALKVMQRSPTPNSLTVLRKRLDWAELSFVALPLPEVSPTQPGYGVKVDPYFDEVLLTFLSLGGKLNTSESVRLTYYGYLGDPKQRLKELFSEDKKSGPR